MVSSVNIQTQRYPPTLRNLCTRPTADLDISFGWHILVQFLAMALAVYAGVSRRDHTFDPRLINTFLLMMPAGFVLGAAWFIPRLMFAKDAAGKEQVRSGYARFAQRFWVSCITITVVFCLLTTR